MPRTPDLRAGSTSSARGIPIRASKSFEIPPFRLSVDNGVAGDRQPSFSDDVQPGTPNFADGLVERHGPDPEQPVALRLHMDISFGQVFTTEMDPIDDLANVVVLVGDAKSSSQRSGAFWATTIDDYVRQTWPESAEAIMEVFALLKEGFTTSNDVLGHVAGSHGDITLRVHTLSQILTLDMHGSIGSQTALVESVAWLYATLQIDRDSHMPVSKSVQLRRGRLSSTSSQIVAAEVSEYSLKVYGDSPIAGDAGSCWTALFPRTPCGTRFWTPPRPQGMEGLTVSFDLMCFLAGVQYQVVEGGGIVLYGRRSMVYPVRQTDDNIQWHFQAFNPREKSQLPPLGQRLLIDDLEKLRSAPVHCLGLWLNGEIMLATNESDFSHLSYSDAKTMPSVTTSAGYQVGSLTSLPKPLALGDNSFKVLKSRRNLYMVDFMVNSLALLAEPIVLYSVQEQRAWMVPYINVLLHIAQAKARYEKVANFGLPVCPSYGNGKAALRCLIENFRRTIQQAVPGESSNETEERCLVQHYIEDIIAVMEAARREIRRARAWMGQSQNIVGFELADIVQMKDKMEMKTHSMGPEVVKGSWLPLLDEVQLVFFCENLPEILLPTLDTDFATPCGRTTWKTVPKGFDLLAASLPCLAYLAEPLGHDTLDALTDKHYWSCPNRTSARCKRVDRHTCYRIQELSSKDGRGPRILHLHAREDGVVVFRHIEKAEAIQAKLDERRGSADSANHVESHDISPQTSRLDSGYTSGDPEDIPVSGTKIDGVIMSEDKSGTTVAQQRLSSQLARPETPPISRSNTPSGWRRLFGHRSK